MNKYNVYISRPAYNDLEEIYSYISSILLSPDAALNTINQIEEAILSLETLPYRGSIRSIGTFATYRYRQIIVNNYIIVYEIKEDTQTVTILAIKYFAVNF